MINGWIEQFKEEEFMEQLKLSELDNKISKQRIPEKNKEYLPK